MNALGWFLLAALLELSGCFAFWAHFRGGRPPGWLAAGLVALVGFAYVLTRVPAAFAGRAYAAYGGVYILASLLWLWCVEGQAPDRWDTLGALCCLVGAACILWPARAV